MIVMQGDFSNVRIGWTLDLKEPNLMKWPNPVESVWYSKFEIWYSKSYSRGIIKRSAKNKLDKDPLNKFPSVNDVEIGERLNRLERFNDGNNNNDNNCRSPLLPNLFSTDSTMMMMMMTTEHLLMIVFFHQVLILTLRKI